MDLATIFMISWLPLLVHLLATGYVAIDAPKYGMNRRFWTVTAFLVPFFGLFAYLFERGERTPDPDRSMFEDGVFEIHESRADDTRLASGGPDDGTEHAEDAGSDDGTSRRE
ncbi:MAG: hypothetical protein V5A32_02540 [Halovenus sp.]